jgi:hypothetical protein
LTAASATFALKAGVWFRRARLLIVAPDSQAPACPLSGRNSTYRPVQICGAGSTSFSLVPPGICSKVATNSDNGYPSWVEARGAMPAKSGSEHHADEFG